MPGLCLFVAIRTVFNDHEDMHTPTTPKPEPLDNAEWANRALLSLLRRSREAIRRELLRRAAEL